MIKLLRDKDNVNDFHLNKYVLIEEMTQRQSLNASYHIKGCGTFGYKEH